MRTKQMTWSVVALLLGGLAAQQPPTGAESEKAPKRVRLSTEARTTLREAAASTVEDLRGLEGDERRAVLQAGAERYAELALGFESEPAAAARAWYECAELWRRQGSLGKAEAAYRSALEHDRGGVYRERALFGRAQMLRRQKMFDQAIALYEEAATVQPESNRAHDSRLWIARCLEAKGESEKALAAFRSALEAAERPRQVIGACNRLANALISRGDLDGADAAIEHASDFCSAAIAEGGLEAERLRRTLDRMSARRALARARDKANGAAKDAVQLEKDRDRRP